MGFTDDKQLAVCFKIELGLKYEYERNPGLTDAICILGLENAKIAAKQQFGFARNESVSSAESIQGIIQGCVALALARIGKIDDLTLKEYIFCLEKIKCSVQRHSRTGSRGYYEFTRDFLL